MTTKAQVVNMSIKLYLRQIQWTVHNKNPCFNTFQNLYFKRLIHVVGRSEDKQILWNYEVKWWISNYFPCTPIKFGFDNPKPNWSYISPKYSQRKIHILSLPNTKAVLCDITQISFFGETSGCFITRHNPLINIKKSICIYFPILLGHIVFTFAMPILSV